MKRLVLDLETLPCMQEGALAGIRAGIKPPGNISKQETLDKWMAENADEAAEESYRKTSFDGSKGEICCIGWAVDNEPVQSVCRGTGGSEADMLRSFFDDVKTDDEYQIIGHNVIAFDIRFLFQRAVILRVKPSFNIRNEERYNGSKVFDTMTYFSGWGNRISLANLCACLNIPVKQGGMDGSQVYDYWRSGRIAEISDYCRTDVEATRSVFKRLTFEELLP